MTKLQIAGRARTIDRRAVKRTACALGLSLFLLTALAGTHAFAEDPIKVGVLHSLSGTMAISEGPPQGNHPHGHRGAQ